jgi:hypothetical protein
MKFKRLNKRAKQKALEVMRDINVEDFDWWDNVYEDFERFAETIGVDVDTNKTYFRMFCQGQGSGFTADVSPVKLIEGIKNGLWKDYAPLEQLDFPTVTEHIETFARLIIEGKIDANVKTHGEDYYIRKSIELNSCFEEDLQTSACEIICNEAEAFLEDALDELNKLLFELLQRDYDYLTSEEAIKETIEANEYAFTREGELVGSQTKHAA